MERKLYKSSTDKKLSGVCAGFAEYFNIDPTWIRIGWVVCTVFGVGSPIIIYIACALIMSDRPRED